MFEQIYKQWVEEDKTEHTIYKSALCRNEYHYKIVVIVPILNQKIQYVMLIDEEKLTNEDFIKRLSDEPKKRLIDAMTKKLINFTHN
jgi:hypothetical protein